MSRARQLALDALPGYDPQKGKLRNHLMNRLRGLQRHTAQANQIISVPEQVALDRNHLWEHEVNLQDELGHPPSDAELANRSGLSLKRIRHIRQYKPGFAESQLAAKGRDDGGGDGWEPGVQRNRGHELLHMIYHELSPVDQLIVEHLSGFNGAPILPGQEIARRTGLTPGRVSQRAAAIQHQLDQLDDAGVL
jgi:DNA-directed RNA polymerase specialized sigma subunit